MADLGCAKVPHENDIIMQSIVRLLRHKQRDGSTGTLYRKLEYEQVQNASGLTFSMAMMGDVGDHTDSPAGRCAIELRLLHFLVHVMF
jgi:hypothetical protein